MTAAVARRWVALDRLRALAVLLMVQGHAFYALLGEPERSSTWYRYHQLIHGLTAPMFLTGAGLAFGITTYPNWEKFRSDDAAHHARLRRYLLILALGYVLQLPGMSLGQTWNAHPERWPGIVKVGPLQLIGVTLLLAQLATRLVPRPALHAALAATLGVAVMLVAPFVWNLQLADVGNSHAALAWLNAHGGSQFPAFPWLAFVLGGMTLGLASLYEAPSRWLRSGWVWAAAGLTACSVTYALYDAGYNPYGDHDFWRSSPIYTIFRAGGVALFLALCSLWASRRAALDRGLAALARHSLLAYVSHLVILYGAYPFPGMVRWFGKRSLELWPTIGAAAFLLALTALILTTWHRALQAPKVADYTRWSLAVACLALLLR